MRYPIIIGISFLVSSAVSNNAAFNIGLLATTWGLVTLLAQTAQRLIEGGHRA